MAIETTSQGTIPAIDLKYLQYSEFHMSIAEKSPYNIAVSGKVRPYGVDPATNIKYYDLNAKNITIPNLDAFVGSLDPTKQAEAATALAKVQEGLGTLASLYLGVTFVGVV